MDYSNLIIESNSTENNLTNVLLLLKGENTCESLEILKSHKHIFNTISKRAYYYKLFESVSNKSYSYYSDSNNFDVGTYQFNDILEIFISARISTVELFNDFALKEDMLKFVPFLKYFIKNKYSNYDISNADLQSNTLLLFDHNITVCFANKFHKIIKLLGSYNSVYFKIAIFDFMFCNYECFINSFIKQVIEPEIKYVIKHEYLYATKILKITNQNPKILELWLEKITKDHKIIIILKKCLELNFNTIESLYKFNFIQRITTLFPFINYLINSHDPNYKFVKISIQTIPINIKISNKRYILCIKLLTKMCEEIILTKNKIYIYLTFFDFVFRHFSIINKQQKLKKIIITKLNILMNISKDELNKILINTEQKLNVIDLWNEAL